MALFDKKKKQDVAKDATTDVGKQPTNQQQMNTRQSAPQPTAMDYIGQQRAKMEQEQMMANDGSINGFKALSQVIGKEQVQNASQILQKYKEGKANLEKKIIENEQWYKVRHWECMRDSANDIQPSSAWLFNCIANKHADAMDNFPAPNVLPREEGDKGEAEMLSSIIPVILDQCDFEQTYSDAWMYKLKTGTGVYGIFWDSSKLNGLGDISIKKVDLLNLFWEPGVTDIQKSRNFFSVELVDNDLLEQEYPQLSGKLGKGNLDVSKYNYDDKVDTTDKTVIVDWYYRKSVNGKMVLHYCKYVNDEVLFATENDPNFADKGWYEHGQYPFIFDTLYPIEGTPTGFGYIDIGKDPQAYIDRGNQAIMQNMLSNCRPRYFIRGDGSVNEEEYADMTKDFIHVDGNLGQDSVIPVQGKPLNNIYVEVINNKIDELKETTGNRDISTGGTTSGVTAASAIAAMQEAGSKLSRDNSKAAYRAYRRMILMVIELIRQFYDMPRCFRILGENGTQRFVQYSNQGIQPQSQGNDFGLDMGLRIPLFDIEITAQKASPYSKMSQNELALQFYQAGFFNPQMADQALACIDMMDFDRKEFIAQKIAQNGGMYMQMMQMQQMMMGMATELDGLKGTNMAQVMMGGGQPQHNGNSKDIGSASDTVNGAGGKESSITENARKRVADSTAPR